jgi:hypothetical protein
VIAPRMFMSGPWLAHLPPAAAIDAMQVGFGGLNVTTPEQAARETERLSPAGVDQIKAHAGLTLEITRRSSRPLTNTSSRYTRTCTRNRTPPLPWAP